MPENGKDKFSFETAPDKIGGEHGGENSGNSEFSFEDVPVLGKKEKTGTIMDLLGGGQKKEAPKKKRPSSADKTDEPPLDIKDDGTDATAGKSDDIFTADTDEWLAAAPKKKKLNKKIIIAASAAGLLLFVAATVVFVLLGRQGTAAGPDGAAPPRRRSKEDMEKARLEEERKKFDAAVAAAEKLISEGEMEKAELKLVELQAKNPEKSPVYVMLARSQFKRGDKDAAVQSYIKAVSAGSDSAEPFVRLCSIYMEQKKFPEALDFSEKGLKKFPEDQSLLRVSARLAMALDDKKKAAELYGKTNKTELTQKELSDYASVLRAGGENRKAREIYIYSGKKFVDSSSFEKAMEVEPDPIEKNSIVNTALGVFEKDEKKISRMMMILVKDLVKSGRKDMASEKLKMISPELLDENDCLLFLRLTIESSSDIVIKDRAETVIAARKDNYHLLRGIQDLLVDGGKSTLSAEIFSGIWAKDHENPTLEYLYARSLDPMESAIEYYNSAISRNPSFGDALLDLGKCLIAHRRYLDAEAALERAVKLNPRSHEANKNLFLSRFYRSRSLDAIKTYRRFLESAKASNIAQTLLKYAQQIADPSYSDSLVSELEAAGDRQARYWRIRHDLVYSRDPARHFSEYYPPEARELYIAFLMGKGKLKDVLLLPTPPDKFPEFWKVFIMWRGKSEGWEDLVATLQEKNKSNGSLEVLSQLMLGKLEPEEARKQIYRVSQDWEPLFYLVLAERYRKMGQKIKSKVCYAKALGDSPGVYSRAIQIFENN